MHRTTRWLPGALLVVAAGCQDLATDPARVPTELRLDQQVVTTTEGSRVDFVVTVLDQDGEEIDTPTWATPDWSVTTPAVLEATDRGVRARAPGSSLATARLAGLDAQATVRVNPAALRLVVAHVVVDQEGNPASYLLPDREAQVTVFLTGDQVNFFRPEVTVKVLRGATVVFEEQVRRAEESVPLAFDPNVTSAAWNAHIPAALVQPGISIVVEADPTGEVPHAEGSVLRFPAAGALALEVQAPQLQLRILAAHLTQSVQTFTGAVPLVAGRDALLRVFVTGDVDTEIETSVRASFLAGGVTVHEATLERNAPIPTRAIESSLANSWNVRIPGDVLQPGVSIVLDANPGNLIGLKAGSVPRVPAAGSLPLDVHAVPKLWVRMIPIHHASYGTGRVDAQNLPDYLAAVTSKFPIDEVDADLRAAYVTQTRANTESGWSQLLSEIYALRVADGSDRYYYGVLRIPGDSPYGGLGYLGFPAAIGHDFAGTGYETFAHELGHNFDLPHAPCGPVSGADPAFPYANGGIGVFGYSLTLGRLQDPAVSKDLMSYCSPEWISDYNYVKAMGFRDEWDWTENGPDRLAARERSLLLWGGVRDGELVLEPAFELEMRPQLPDGTGPYRIEGFDPAGASLFAYRFDPRPLDHDDAASFAFSVPARLAGIDRLSTLRLTGPEGEVVRRARPLAEPVVTTDRRAPGLALAWQPGYEMALVRDAATGEVISFARGGSAALPDRDVEVILSDGVRSYSARAVIR